MSAHRWIFGAFVVASVAIAFAGCSNKSSSGSTPTVYAECRVGAESSMTLTDGDGKTTTITPWGCFLQGPTTSGGRFFGLNYRTTDGIDGVLLIDLAPTSDGSASYVTADVGDAVPPTTGIAPSTDSGSVKVWMSTAASTSSAWNWWTTAAGGSVTVQNTGGWPTNSAMGAAEAAFEWVTAPMNVRPCAMYAPGGGAFCGDKPPSTSGTPPKSPGSLEGKLILRFGATAEECNPPSSDPGSDPSTSGGAACTQVATCKVDGDCKCIHATCNHPPDPTAPSTCCVQNGLPCGTAGGGADCCSGHCGANATCVAAETNPKKCGGDTNADGGTPGDDSGSTLYFGCEESGGVCQCAFSSTPPSQTKCLKSYDCCVGFDSSTYSSPGAPLYGNVTALCQCTSLAPSDPNCHLTGQISGIWNHAVGSCP